MSSSCVTKMTVFPAADFTEEVHNLHRCGGVQISRGFIGQMMDGRFTKARATAPVASGPLNSLGLCTMQSCNPTISSTSSARSGARASTIRQIGGSATFSRRCNAATS